jgi:hypothetical protein
VFLATKLEAFHSRGNNDFLASHDLEDVVTVVDGRPELADEMRAQGLELQAFLCSEFSSLLLQPDFVSALPGYLPGDPASQGRLPALIGRIQALAEAQPVK